MTEKKWTLWRLHPPVYISVRAQTKPDTEALLWHYNGVGEAILKCLQRAVAHMDEMQGRPRDSPLTYLLRTRPLWFLTYLFQ